jgi:hypothetical protein
VFVGTDNDPTAARCSTTNDWIRGNAVVETPEGDILVSMRQNSTVVRIDRASGDGTWKPSPPTSAGQHAPMPLPNDHMLLLDNQPYRPHQSLVGARRSRSRA